MAAHELGQDAIRFSSMPALGGDGYVFELRRDTQGGARAKLTWLYGHPGLGWEPERHWAFDISPRTFGEFRATVDAALARVRPRRDPPGPDEPETIIVCTDGPGFLTERVLDGAVLSMTGFCPYAWEEEHPNRLVEAGALDIICPRFRQEFNPRDGLGAACIRRDRRLRSARR